MCAHVRSGRVGRAVTFFLSGRARLPGTDAQFRSYLVEKSGFVFGYDQIKTPPHKVDLLDLAIPAFLDAVPRFGKLREGVGERHWAERLADATRALRSLPANIDLWDWRDTVAHRTSLTTVFRACRFDWYASASVTKMLHRKRPRLIPILDSQVLDVWSPGWTFDDLVDVAFALGAELGERESSRAALRKVADELGPPYSDLSTLRLYDIASYWRFRE